MNPGTRNNIIAGLFIVFSLALGVWASFLLSDNGVRGGLPFTVRFTLANGATGIKQGSPVLLGGQQIGQVERVSFDRVKNGPPVGVLVHVRVQGDLPLFRDALVFLDRPLLGSLSSINIADAGGGIGGGGELGGGQVGGQVGAQGGASGVPVDSAPINAGDVVDGMLAPPAFLASAGYGPEQVQQVKRAIATLDSILGKAEKTLDSTSPKFDMTLADARTIVSDLRQNLGKWSATADGIMADVKDATGKLPPLIDDAKAGVADARALLASAQSVITENRAKIDQVVANVEQFTTRLNQETGDLLNKALKDAQLALGSASDVLKRFSAVLTEEEPGLRRMLANFRLMSDQLKLTAIEVRSQPWRLLHQPNTKELNSQVFYDSTRSYAEAASDLRAAAESLQSATAPGAISTPEDVQRLVVKLTESYGKYHEAEKKLLEKLVGEQSK
jgi:ABC-type transporter Mla subunit MlaD